MKVEWITEGLPPQLHVTLDDGTVVAFSKEEANQLHLATEATCDQDCRCFQCGKEEGQYVKSSL